MKKEVKDENNKKMTFLERLKDKRERAKIELIIYGVFFIGIILFVRILGGTAPNTEINNNEQNQTFLSALKDNYEYDIAITLNEETYYYFGKVLGNNKTINVKEEENINSYYLMNKKYYILENENYILTDESEVYKYLDYRYINLEQIKEYIKISTKENNTYKVKLSELVLNNESDEYITINIGEGDNNIVIDYTQLLKLSENNIEKAIVNITYSNINNIISLEE